MSVVNVMEFFNQNKPKLWNCTGVGAWTLSNLCKSANTYLFLLFFVSAERWIIAEHNESINIFILVTKKATTGTWEPVTSHTWFFCNSEGKFLTSKENSCEIW